MKRAKNYEACVCLRRDPSQYRVLSDHTTSRAALNAMAFRAAFGPPEFVYRVRDKRTGEWVSQLSGE